MLRGRCLLCDFERFGHLTNIFITNHLCAHYHPASHLTATSSLAGACLSRAAASKLAQLGIHVIVVGRDAARGEKTVAEIRQAGGKADFISSDLRDALSAREVARKAIELGSGQVDILVNNARIYPFGPTHETTEESFDRVYSLNVKVPYFLVAELAPLMAKRGKGAIVNLPTMVFQSQFLGTATLRSSAILRNKRYVSCSM